MTRIDVQLVLQLLVAAALLYACFCRIVRVDNDTHREVRWALTFEAMCAGMVFGAPFLPQLMPAEAHWQPGTTPEWIWLALLLSVTVVHLVTARAWCDGAAQQALKAPNRAGASNAAMPALAVLLLLVSGLSLPSPSQAQAPGALAELRAVHGLVEGETIRCADPSGCVAMTGDTFNHWVQAAQAAADTATECLRQRKARPST